MEGQADIEKAEKDVSKRFKIVFTVDTARKNRVAGEWDMVVPTLLRE